MLESKSTGYPSIDKPWLKYYSDEAIHTSLPKMSAYQYLYDCNKDYLDFPALEYFHKTFSFRQLFQNIDRLASCFRAIGVKEGDTVVICSANTPETVYMFYALNKIGAISNMVDPRTSPAGIASYIQESYASVVVVLDVAYSKIASITSSLEKVIVLSPVESLFLLYKTAYQLKNSLHIAYSQKVISYQTFLSMFRSSPLPPCPYVPNRCCVIEHTGGTTGTPKSVMLSNENINAVAIQSVLTGIDMKREHTWLDIMPPFIAYGIGMGLHLPLIIGMKVILIPSFDAAKFDYLIAKHRPIHMVGVPSYWETIINSKKLKHADLSYMIAPTVGGDSMDTTLEKRSNQFLQEHNCTSKIVKGYGMTEVCGGVAGTVPQKNPIGVWVFPLLCVISPYSTLPPIMNSLITKWERFVFPVQTSCLAIKTTQQLPINLSVSIPMDANGSIPEILVTWILTVRYLLQIESNGSSFDTMGSKSFLLLSNRPFASILLSLLPVPSVFPTLHICKVYFLLSFLQFGETLILKT